MELRQVFAENMRKTRKERGLTQDDLGELCDSARNYIGEIERGEKTPTLDMVEIIANALKVDAHTMLRRD